MKGYLVNKPIKKHHHEKTFDYIEIREYLQYKYRVSLEAHKAPSGEYRNFWHWLIDHSDVANDSFFYIPVDYYNNTEPPKDKEWVKEILCLIKKEFPDLDGSQVWISW